MLKKYLLCTRDFDAKFLLSLSIIYSDFILLCFIRFKKSWKHHQFHNGFKHCYIVPWHCLRRWRENTTIGKDNVIQTAEFIDAGKIAYLSSKENWVKTHTQKKSCTAECQEVVRNAVKRIENVEIIKKKTEDSYWRKPSVGNQARKSCYITPCLNIYMDPHSNYYARRIPYWMTYYTYLLTNPSN